MSNYKFNAYVRIYYNPDSRESVIMQRYGEDQKAKGKTQLLDQERLPILLYQLVDADYNVFKESTHIIFAIAKEFQEKLMTPGNEVEMMNVLQDKP